MRAGIALGSNLGDRLENLRAARRAIVDLGSVNQPILVSGLYETAPVDCEPTAGKFLNTVIEIGYAGEAGALLAELSAIEQSLGRQREHARNISRSVDLDLLYFGDREISIPDLQLPHPRMYSRRFVLEPLADIRPELILPKQTETVRELLARLSDAPAVVRIASEW